jgi:hypothetical protein
VKIGIVGRASWELPFMDTFVVRNIKSTAELGRVWSLSKRYSGNRRGFSETKAKFKKYPDLFIGCFKNGKLIVEASGNPHPKSHVGLHSISVEEGHQKEGLGLKLIRFFEKNAAKYESRVTVASGKKSDGFYLKAKYRPLEILLQVGKRNLPDNYSELADLSRERNVGKDKFLYVKVKRYIPRLRDSLETKLHAYSANFIFGRVLK